MKKVNVKGKITNHINPIEQRSRVNIIQKFVSARHRGLNFISSKFFFHVEKVISTHITTEDKRVFSGRMKLVQTFHNGDILLMDSEEFEVRLPLQSNRITAIQHPEMPKCERIKKAS